MAITEVRFEKRKKNEEQDERTEQREQRAERAKSREKKAVRLLFWYCLCAYWQLWQQLS